MPTHTMPFRFLPARLLGGMNEEREEAGSLATLGMTNQKSKSTFHAFVLLELLNRTPKSGERIARYDTKP